MKVSLAEALLRRKELAAKVAQLQQINTKDLYEVKFQRKAISDSIDDIVAQVPKLVVGQVTAAYDWHARRLRLVDLAIQQANHMTTIELDESVMADYTEQK